jgi:hypothetical protein
MREEWYWATDVEPLESYLTGATDAAAKEAAARRWERDTEESAREMRRWRVKQARKALAFLRLCRRTPAAARPWHPCEWKCGSVYLVWCPTHRAYRIGRSDNLPRRITEHLRDFDPRAELCVGYHTPVDLRLFERALHHHFSHRHVKRSESEELFDLTREEVRGFEATAAAIEHRLLAVEVLRMAARLAEYKEDCRRPPPPVVAPTPLPDGWPLL